MNWKSFLTALIVLSISACHSPGPSVKKAMPAPTRLATIAVAEPDGAVIILVDRSTWIIEPDDRDTARQWKKADLVEAISRASSSDVEFPDVLTNQETGSSIHARQSTNFGE